MREGRRRRNERDGEGMRERKWNERDGDGMRERRRNEREVEKE